MAINKIYNIPIALFFFNRPEKTQATFEQIREIRPLKLFLISDGPRLNVSNEINKVELCRSIVHKIDWECEVFTNFSDVNMGCKFRISSGISWVFEFVESAVILEDDCLPSPIFFEYARDMLLKYRNDYDVYSISGTSFLDIEKLDGYLLSDYTLMWGWATWKDRWEKYDLHSKDYLAVIFRKWAHNPLELLYWVSVFLNLVRGKVDTWDYQWILTVWRHNAKCIRPLTNLVKNTGFDSEATHTKSGARFSNAIPDYYEFQPKFYEILDLKIIEKFNKVDKEKWALINIKTVLYLLFPGLLKVSRKLKILFL